MYCQKCRTPLKLDSSLEDLTPAAYDLLVAASSQPQPHEIPSTRLPNPQDRARRGLYHQASKNATAATFKRHNSATMRPDGRLARDNSAMSFIYLTESQMVPPNIAAAIQREQQFQGTGGQATSQQGAPHEDSTLGREMARIAKLFEIVSARSDIDHPVCVECTELLVEELQKKLEISLHERDTYANFLKRLQTDQPSNEEIQAQKEALAKAQQEEKAALEELRKLEAAKASLDDEILALEEESRQLDRDEEQFWRERNEYAMKLAAFQNERDSINAKYDHDSALLDKLQRSNVYNDIFCISHDGTFATINGLRLGRLSSKPVDWAEINAAWGHALLLLVTVADKLNYKFDSFEPQPMGSTSKIIRYDPVSPPSSSRLTISRPAPPPAPKKHVLELWSSGEMPLGLSFMHRKFDNAMVAFLELVRQLGNHIHQQTEQDGSALSLPYKIDGDKIGDVSIKLGGIAQDEGWTKACKLTLTCCKFLLAHASNVSSVAAARA